VLPLILSASLMASAGNFSLIGPNCEEQQADTKKYYGSALVGVVFLFGGVLLLERDHRGMGGFALGVGTPLAGLGLAGMFELYKW